MGSETLLVDENLKATLSPQAKDQVEKLQKDLELVDNLKSFEKFQSLSIPEKIKFAQKLKANGASDDFFNFLTIVLVSLHQHNDALGFFSGLKLDPNTVSDSLKSIAPQMSHPTFACTILTVESNDALNADGVQDVEQVMAPIIRWKNCLTRLQTLFGVVENLNGLTI